MCRRGLRIFRKIIEMRYVWFGLLVLSMLALSGWTMMLYSDAVIDWWIVPAVALAVGLATGLHMWRIWRRVTGAQSMPFNYICHAVVTCVMLSFLFFWVNDEFSDRDAAHTERGVVSAHFKEERHRTRRVGRRYVNTGEKYYVYSLEITLPSTEPKRISVTYDRYRNVRDGDTVTVPVREGFLGITLLDVDSLKFQPHPKVKKKSRLKYFGRRPKSGTAN